MGSVKGNRVRMFRGKSNKGFTLLELLGVIIVLGIISAIINNIMGNAGVSVKARAEQKYDAASKVASGWLAVVQTLRVSSHPLNSNLFLAAGHDALDVLIPVDPTIAMNATYRNKWNQTQPIKSMEQFNVITMPTATARGVYSIGNEETRVTINYDAPSRLMSIIFTEVDEQEVRELVDLYEPSGTATTRYVAATPDTSGTIRYDALDTTTNTHTLTIVRKL